jgi:hypothetical protein
MLRRPRFRTASRCGLAYESEGNIVHERQGTTLRKQRQGGFHRCARSLQVVEAPQEQHVVEASVTQLRQSIDAQRPKAGPRMPTREHRETASVWVNAAILNVARFDQRSQ